MACRYKAVITSLALAILCLGVVTTAKADTFSFSSVTISARETNDDPTSNLTVINGYPNLISFSDLSVDNNGAAGGFANRHVWRFSTNGGASAYSFTNDSFFDVSMNLTLSGDASPRKEAGFLFDTLGGQGQFIVNTDAHEVVAFGGPLPFYTFSILSFNSGDMIQLGMTYFRDSDGKRKIIYHAGGLSSGALEFTNLEQGIVDGSTLGGYLQVQIDPNNPNNGATAEFSNVETAVVPEPTTMLLLGTGLAGLGGMIKRKRQGKE
jgi:hypothetical protein